jgi:lipopolysaccharide export system protein LptA
MNEPASLTEEISRHFDATNTADETANLAAMLTADPVAAQAFARAARTDALLEKALGKPMKPKLIRHPWRWASIAALLVAAGLVGTKFWSDAGEEPQVVVRLEDMSKQSKSAGPKDISAQTRRISPNASTQTKMPADIEDYLKNYYVNLPLQGLTIPQALAQLETEVQAANYLKQPWLTRLRFSAPPSASGVLIPSFLGVTSSVWSILKAGALLHPITVDADGTKISLMPPMTFTGPPIQDVTRVFAIPAELELRYQAAQKLHHISSDGPPFPFKNYLRTFFELDLIATENATLLPTQNRVILKASEDKVRYFEAGLEALGSTEVQVLLTSKILNCAVTALPLSFDITKGMIMTDQEFQKFTRSLIATNPNGMSLTLPSIVTRNSQRARMEIIREIPTLDRSGQNQTFPWIGLVTPIDPSFLGEIIRCTGSCEFCLPDHETLPSVGTLDELTAKLKQWDGTKNIRSYPTDFEAYIPDGSTAVFSIDVRSDKGITLFCLSVTKMSPNGEPMSKRQGLTVDAKSSSQSKDNLTSTFTGEVRLRAEDYEIDCEELGVKHPSEKAGALPKAHSLKDSGMELHAKSAKDGKISFIRRGHSEIRGTCKELDFDPTTGILTLRGFPILGSNGDRIEGVGIDCIFTIDTNGKIHTQGPVKFPANR